MNLGELFINIVTKGDTKKLDEAKQKLEQAQKTSEKNSEKNIKQNKKEAKANNETAKSIQGISNAIKAMSGGLKGTGGAISSLGAMGGAAGGAVVAVGALVTAITMTYAAIDRMVNSLAQANQQMITFQRTSGISLSSLNKYASANAAVNFNSSIEGTAQSMQRVANNLWDIQMGRGDISPFQELAFVGGKAFNPYGMSVEEVIENVREAIKGVDDLQATNIIQRMGFAPDDLMMLRMSREEFEKISDSFLSPQQREAMNQYALELKQIQLAFQKTNQSLTIDLAKPFLVITRIIQKKWEEIYKTTIKPLVAAFKFVYNSIKGIVQFSQDWIRAMANAFTILKPILAIFRAIYLIFEDIATYYAGGDSVFGDFINGIAEWADNFENMFENSKIAEFFQNLKDGIISLTTIKIPKWLSDFFSMIGNNALQTARGMGFGGNNPEPVNTNQLSYATSNTNTNNSFTINTNQPTDMVATNLINTFTPTQVQLEPIAV